MEINVHRPFKGTGTRALLHVLCWVMLLALLPALASADQRGPDRTTRSPHGPLAIPCENCHTATAWKPIRAIPEFDHNKTRYPLRGMHEKVQCTECHTKPIFTDVGKNCEDCHTDIHNRKMGTNCAECHTVQGWSIAVQQVKDHQNRFPLLGAHAAVQCDDCHKGAAVGQFQGLSTACISCHQADFQKATNPNHIQAQFPQTCETCHSFDSWLGATVNHAAPPINFPLTNGHANVACQSCHIGGNYNLHIVATDCGNSQCHLTTWQQTNNPTHTAAPTWFPIASCSNCHTTVSWLTANFDHSTTGFPLSNSHAMAPAGKVNACTDCHLNNNYNLQIAATDCGNAGCHLNTNYGGGWQGTNNPPHASAGPTFAAANCSNCHNTVSFLTATFDHSVTGFPLTNSHQLAPAGKVNACTDCHLNNNYTLTMGPTDCGNSGCHLSTNYGGGWQGTTNPIHSAAGPGFAAANCSNCHNTITFLSATFDHSVTGFPLTNSHQMAPAGKVNACTDCHLNGNYNLTMGPTDCGNSGCHLSTNYGGGWQGTTNPVHPTAGAAFAAANCSTCHNTVSFLTATFDHSVTGFPLANSHQMAPAGKVNACTDCHINNNYTLTMGPTECGNSGCHLSTNYGGGWQGTTNPVHPSAGPTFAAANCSNCHNTVSFLSATFDHSTTGWPLTGSHQMSPAGKVNACTDCHVNNNYTFTTANTDCYGCHQAAWNSTPTFGGAVPNHIAAGFPTSLCSQCHDTIAWTNSTFNHASTGFPLTNSHQTAPAGKVTGCDQCHAGNYTSMAIQPTDCGNAGCHLNTNYGGGWQGTTNPVHPSAGPTFAAANCANCHNTITFLSATFDHSTTGWPLTGSHQLSPAGKVNACTDCHVNNNYTFTTANTDCYGCHQAAWNSTPTFGGAVPNHITSGFPTSLCSQCHDTVAWTNSTFNHANTGFPLTSSHQIVPAGKVTGCDQCHAGNYSSLAILPTDCGNAGCHLTTYNTTNNPVHSTAGAPFAIGNCSTCHTPTVWTTATFDHSTTGFPLTGAHQLAPAGKANLCTDCHTANNYTAGFPPMDCGNSGCHLKDWNNTPTYGGNIPNHISAGFPITMCSTCHDTVLWTDGKFDHSTTGFALQGAHMIPPRTTVTGAIGPMVNACTDCHVGGNYTTGYPTTDCYGCHQTYYTNAQTYGASVPNHVSANYPTTCISCHTTYVTTAWLGAVFNHTAFKIPHHGSVCTDCHINATNYAIESCENCHTVPTAHQPGMSHPNVCSPSPACWYNGGTYGPGSRCVDCHKG